MRLLLLGDFSLDLFQLGEDEVKFCGGGGIERLQLLKMLLERIVDFLSGGNALIDQTIFEALENAGAVNEQGQVVFTTLLAPGETYAVAEVLFNSDLFTGLDSIWNGTTKVTLETIQLGTGAGTVENAYVFDSPDTDVSLSFKVYNIPAIYPSIVKLDVGGYPENVHPVMNFSVYEIAADAVGCDKVRVEPHAVAGITWAKGHLDTPKGRISVSWRLENGQLKIEKTLPPGIVEL